MSVLNNKRHNSNLVAKQSLLDISFWMYKLLWLCYIETVIAVWIFTTALSHPLEQNKTQSCMHLHSHWSRLVNQVGGLCGWDFQWTSHILEEVVSEWKGAAGFPSEVCILSRENKGVSQWVGCTESTFSVSHTFMSSVSKVSKLDF